MLSIYRAGHKIRNSKAVSGWISYSRMGAVYTTFSITGPRFVVFQYEFLIWEWVRCALTSVQWLPNFVFSRLDIMLENGCVLHKLQYNESRILCFPVNLSLLSFLRVFLEGVLWMKNSMIRLASVTGSKWIQYLVLSVERSRRLWEIMKTCTRAPWSPANPLTKGSFCLLFIVRYLVVLFCFVLFYNGP